MSQSFPKHLRSMSFAIAGIMALIAAINLVADPYQCFRCFNIRSLREAAAGYGTRMGKGEMIVGRDWDILLLGTSRVEGALDPAHPAFSGCRVYNAGLPGADFPELEHAARSAMKRGTLKRLILCLDLFCFDPNWHPSTDSPSLTDPNVNHAEYYLANFLSLSATEASFDTIRDARSHLQAKDYPLGLFAPHVTPGDHRRADWPLGGALRLTLPDGIVERAGASPLSGDRFHSLGVLLDDASRAGVKVDVVHLPMHATGLEGYAALHIWPVYEQWIRALSEAVSSHNRRFPDRPATFWDFCRYNAITTDPTFENSVWFYDSFHLKVPLGNLAIDQIMNFRRAGKAVIPNLGLVVTESNIESHLAQLRRDRDAYYAANPEVAQIDKAITKAYRDQN